MTVKELRDKLATLPDEMEVVHEYDGMWSSDALRVWVVDLLPPHDGNYEWAARWYPDLYKAPEPPRVSLVCIASESDARYVGDHPCREVTT